MTKAQNKLLKKKISELTPAELKQLEKPLGTVSRPFPMQGIQRVMKADGSVDLELALSVIADDLNHMKVYSERPYSEVIALAYCDMPVPSMLPIFKEGLERRRPESTNRTQMMIGDPGHGKSFLGALQGRLRSRESVEIFDCGGKNMNDLLFEMVLDFGTVDTLPDAIDKRAKAGVLEPMSLGLLEQLNSLEAMPADYAMDAEKAAEWRAKRTYVTFDDQGRPSIDWEGIKAGGSEKVNKALHILKEVSAVERLDKEGGNALGMNSQFGPLIRAFLENREIVLDEYNKSRDGTDNALQTVWQFLIGELRECTVENPLKNKDSTSGPSSFTFRRDDTGMGFFVTLTGNRTVDGNTTRSLNKSVYSRLSPVTLPNPEVIDWQHRICQMMVGLPVSTLYEAFQEKADNDPRAFGEWLMWLRRTKAQAEGVPVPELQETLLANWKDVVEASRNLAEFYNTWSTMTDSEKIIAANYSDLIEEVDEEYTKVEGIDFRKIKQHLEQAIAIAPMMIQSDAYRALDTGAWDQPPELAEKVEENPALNFGTRLTRLLEDVIYQKSEAVGKHRLYAKLKKAMETHRFRDVVFKDGKRSEAKSIEQALNISAFNDPDLKKQALMAQKIFCDYLRQQNPEITATNDEIVMPEKVLKSLQQVAGQTDGAKAALFVPNTDLDTLVASPIAGARIEDAVMVELNKGEFNFSFDDVVSHDDFMASLALPTISKQNLSAVWDKNIRLLSQGSTEAAPASGTQKDHDEGLRIAENTSLQTGLGLTSLQVRHGEQLVSVHILRNASNKTLVVSEKVSSKMLAAFKEAGITHVDRASSSAEAEVEAALAEMTRGQKDQASVRKRLMDAFRYRNEPSPDYLKLKYGFTETGPETETDFLIRTRSEYMSNKTISQALIDKRIDMGYQKILVKSAPAAA